MSGKQEAFVNETTIRWTADRIAALPEGQQFGMQKIALTPDESAKGEKLVGETLVTFRPGVHSLILPEPRPTIAIFLEEDDVQSYVDGAGACWSLGRFADGEWFRQRHS